MKRRTAAAFWLVATLGAAHAAPGVAFDQADKTYYVGQPPVDATFDVLSSAVRASGYVDPLFPSPAGNPNYALTVDREGAAKRFAGGLIRHFSFLGTQSRVDDLLSQKSTIALPDVPKVIYLDNAAKTYRIVTGPAAQLLVTTVGEAQVVEGLVGSGLGGDAETLGVKISTKPLGPRTFGDYATDGYELTIAATTQAATGSCPQIEATRTVTSYIDTALEEPSPALKSDPVAEFTHLTLGNCTATYKREIAGVPPHGFVFYNATAVQTRMLNFNMTMAFATVVARANVKPIGSGDAALFAIPPGYAPAQDPAAAR